MSDPAVLLVEDDTRIGDALRAGFEQARYTCARVASGIAAIETASERGWDLVLLDLGLPDLDGLDVCRALRARLPHAIIIVLTARDAEIDVVVGLEAGADDYLVKPVGMTELLARVRVHLRRTSVNGTSLHRRQVGSLTIDVAGRRAWVGGREVHLRMKLFDLLLALASQPNVAVSRDALMGQVWDAHWFGSTKTLDVHVAELRRQLTEIADAAGVDAPQIATLRGFGFRLEA